MPAALAFLAALLGELADRLRRAVAPLGRRLASERGDVPGWVLITIMTAGLVILLWTVAGDLLVQVFTDAISRVSSR